MKALKTGFKRRPLLVAAAEAEDEAHFFALAGWNERRVPPLAGIVEQKQEVAQLVGAELVAQAHIVTEI